MADYSRTTSRPIQSCVQCRRRKIKCDKTYPCTSCTQRGEADECREVEKSVPSSSKTTVETLESVSRRVFILEQTVQRLVKLVPANGGITVDELSPTPTPPPNRTPSANTIRSAYGRTSTDEDVAMMLEDFAMGHRVNRARAAQELSPELPSSYLPRSRSFDGHPLAVLIDPSTDILARVVALLPDERSCRILVEYYLERLEWYSKVLHVPAFIAEVNTLWTQLRSSSHHLVRVSFLGVYFMVLCLAYHLIEPYVCERLGTSLLSTSELAKKMYAGAQACIHYDEFLGSHSLEHLQCIVLMGVYQQNLDEADAHWALLGSAIKIAQNLGMSRLGSESENRSYSSGWSSLIKRETARRVWWHLIFNDWSHAAAHNGTYSVHPSQNHTGFPANVNDADLVDDQPLIEHEAHEYTEMTFSLTRLRFVELYRQVVDNMQAPTGYSFILEMDVKLAKMMDSVPSYFGDMTEWEQHRQGGQVSVRRLELTLALIMGETRRLRLHRPSMFRGMKDPRYVISRVQCFKSAQAILELLKSDDEQAAILLKWWIVLFYGFAAAVVLFIELCYRKAEGYDDLDGRRKVLREALDMFKTAEHVSIVSRNAIALLEGLLNAEPDLPANPSRKRKAPDDESAEEEDSFTRIVKYILIDASNREPMPSPTLASSLTYSYQLPWAPEQARDVLAPGVLLRDEGMFQGPRFDDSTMVEVGQLLYDNAYGFVQEGHNVPSY